MKWRELNGEEEGKRKREGREGIKNGAGREAGMKRREGRKEVNEIEKLAGTQRMKKNR